jgi:Flp pilus assembly protein CpaB
MGDSLNPTLLGRLSRLARPDFARTVAARRITAGLLVLLAGGAAWRPDPDSDRRDVVIAIRDFAPGVVVGTEDVALRRVPAATVPDGALAALDGAVGARIAGPVRRGEVLTDARVLGSRQTKLTAGPDARNVPVRLADAAVLEVIRPGDVVDVLGAPSDDRDARARLLASDAVVVFISPAGTDRVALLALPGAAANALAAASLVQSLTLTIH